MNEIDCIIAWVDGADQEWIKLKKKYSGNVIKEEEDDEQIRYRDLGVLKYLFRGIEKFMPWIRNIYLVTCGQIPDWLNCGNSRLRLVNHEDYIPTRYLPTFSSHTIELNFHRINDLSERFIYFNDDMFVLAPTKETDFFKHGLPCDTAVLNAIAMEKGEDEFRFLMPINDIEIINKYFNKSECMRKYRGKFYNALYGKDVFRTICLRPWIHFTGFYNYHFPYGLLKSTLQELWEKEPKVLDDTCSHKFRNSNDVNIWLASYWQFAAGRFVPRSPKIGYTTYISDDICHNEDVYEHIREQKSKLVVINDNIVQADIKELKQKLTESFEVILPEKCSFEK